MPDSKQNPAAARASEVGVVWGHFLKVARRSSYVEVMTVMTVWCYDGMLIWNLRRTGDLIGLANSIAGAGRGEVDCKDVGFEGFGVFELDFACPKGLRRSWPLIGWNGGPDAELRSIAKTSVLNELSSLLDQRLESG